MGKITQKEMSKLFSLDHDVYSSFLAAKDMVKCRRNVNFEEMDTQLSTGKRDGF